MTGPYGTAATAYWKAGWRGIVPLPAKAKKYPPAGYTGGGGIDPSYADVDAWTTGPERLGNIALRMPTNIIGIDVDAYGDKPGEQTLKLAEAAHGPLPPTWRTTSRDDGISGIRFYRVPEALAWPGELGPATECIQTRHRYAVVWPSIHPEGKTYRWIGPDGVVSTTVPDPDDLPALPDSWVEAYTGGELAADVARVKVEHSDAVAWVVGRSHATETMCSRMERATDQMADDLVGSAHNAGRDATLRIARLADEGHHGAVHALSWARKAFLDDATDTNRTLRGEHRRTHDEAVYEWGELLASAVGVVLGNPSGVVTCDCYGQITAVITGTVDGSSALAPLEQPATSVAETTPDPEPDGLKRMRDGASFILDAPATVPSIWGDGDECLWAVGEALMVVGPPGVGKTTLCGQIVRGLLGLQDHVLGMAVTPTLRRVLYLAMDRPAQIARGLRRIFYESERVLLAERMRVWEGPPPGDVARHPDVLLSLATLADADIIVIDSMKDAAIGLTEDEVAAAYNRARQTCLANNVQVLELHHMVKRGVGGNKPTDLADVYGSAWLTAGAGSVLLLWGAAGDPIVEMRHLKQPASEVGPWRLIHDHNTGQTTIWHGTDLIQMLGAAGDNGVTAKAAASVKFDSENPTRAQIQKARNSLDKLVEQGHATRTDTPSVTGAGKPSAVYRSNHSRITSTPSDQPNHTNHIESHTEPIRAQDRITDRITRITDKDESQTPPPLIGGRASSPAESGLANADCNGCGRSLPIITLEVFKGYCPGCAKERA